MNNFTIVTFLRFFRLLASYREKVLILCFVLVLNGMMAQISSTPAGGNWALTTTWVGGVVPTATDDVIIVAGSNVVVRDPYDASPATVNSLTIDGTVTMGSSSTARKLHSNTFIQINSGGTLTNNGLAAHQLSMGGDFIINQGTFNALVGSGTIQVTFNGTGAQLITGTSTAISFQSLIINKTAGQSLSTSGSISSLSAASFTQMSGDFVSPPTLTVPGNVVLTSGAFTAGDNLNIGGNFTNSVGATFTAGTGTVTFNGASQTISGGNTTVFNNVITSGFTSTTNGYHSTINGNLTIGDGTNFIAGGFNLTVNGTTTVGSGIGGSLQISSTAGSKVFTGLVTVSSGSVWNNSINENIRFLGGLTNLGIFIAGSGTYTFDTNSQDITGTVSIPTVAVPTITLNNKGVFTIATSLSGSGSIVQASGATLNLEGANTITTLNAASIDNTVNYSGSAQTVKGTNYTNLGLSGSGVKSLQTGTTAVSGNLTLNGTASTTTVVGLTIGGNLIIGNGATFTAAGFNLTVSGSTNVGTGSSGSFIISATAGTKTFVGNVTVSSGAMWDNAIGEGPYFNSGIANYGTFTAGSAFHTFDINPQSLYGTLSIPNITITGVTVTNYGTLTVSTALSGTGTFVQGFNSTLNIEGSSSISTINANTDSNTVNFSGPGAQTVKGINYVNLGLSGGGTKTLTTSTTSITGSLILSGTVNTSTAVALTIAGNLVIGDGTSLGIKGFDLSVGGSTSVGNSGSGGFITFPSNIGNKTFGGLVTINSSSSWDNSTNNESINFHGGILNNGTFAAGTGLYTFDTSNQSLTGDLTIPRIDIISITLTNYNSLMNGTSLSGTGTLEMGSLSLVTIDGTSTLSAVSAPPTGSLVIYNAAAPTIIPGTYGNLQLNQSSGDATLSASTQVNGQLDLLTGNLNVGSNNLILGDTASFFITSPSETKMIIASGGGEIRKIFTAAGSFTFPIGDKTATAEYSPITVDVTDGSDFSAASYIGVSVVDAKHPSNVNGSAFLTRYWNVTQFGITGCTANVSGTYLPTDFTGVEGNIKAAQLNGTFNQTTNGWKKYSALSSNLLTATSAVLTSGQTSAFSGIKGASPTVNITGGGVTTCAGAAVHLNSSVSGGDPSFVYSWSPANGLSATNVVNPTATLNTTETYTLTVFDGNGITASNMTTITRQAPTVTVNNLTICSGSSGILTASGANTYTWSPASGLSGTTGASVTASPTSDATYTVTGTGANSCTAQATATVTVHSKPTVVVNSPTICSGTSTTLTASGASTYSWSPATGLTPTTGASVTANPTNTITYTVTGTDANTCTNTATSTVTVNSTPAQPTITASDLDTDSPTLTSSSATGNQWFKDGGSISGATSQALDVTSAGSYTVSVTANSCTSPASSAFVIIVTGLENSGGSIKLYPNPASEILQIDWTGFEPGKEIEVRVIDMIGRSVITKVMLSSENELDVKSLINGQHVFQARQSNILKTVRFVKK